MAVRVEKIGDVAVVTPEGQFWGGKETDDLENVFKELAAQGNAKAVLNLEKVDYLNSTALGVLVSAHSNYSKRGGAIKLTNLDKRVKSIFVITKLTLVFDVCDDNKTALKAFETAGPAGSGATA
jgi:anti-sigma B factor antagonist